MNLCSLLLIGIIRILEATKVGHLVKVKLQLLVDHAGRLAWKLHSITNHDLWEFRNMRNSGYRGYCKFFHHLAFFIRKNLFFKNFLQSRNLICLNTVIAIKNLLKMLLKSMVSLKG